MFQIIFSLVLLSSTIVISANSPHDDQQYNSKLIKEPVFGERIYPKPSKNKKVVATTYKPALYQTVAKPNFQSHSFKTTEKPTINIHPSSQKIYDKNVYFTKPIKQKDSKNYKTIHSAYKSAIKKPYNARKKIIKKQTLKKLKPIKTYEKYHKVTSHPKKKLYRIKKKLNAKNYIKPKINGNLKLVKNVKLTPSLTQQHSVFINKNLEPSESKKGKL